MPAIPLAELLNFEGRLTHAATGILAAGGFTTALARNSTTARPDTFIAVSVDVGPASTRLGRRPDGSTEHAQYQATLHVLVAVERKLDNPSGTAAGSLLDQRCGAIRALFLNHPNPFPAYEQALQVHAIRPLATEYDVDTGTEADTRVLSWELHFIISDDAWPAE